MRILLFCLSLMSHGCLRTLAPTGPSIAPPAGLEEASVTAVAYWNTLGLHLEAPAADGLAVEVEPALAGWAEWGRTDLTSESPPRIRFAAQVASEAAGNDLHRAYATRAIAHEIGHALGLHHVEDRESVMYPYVNGAPLGDPPAAGDFDLARGLR